MAARSAARAQARGGRPSTGRRLSTLELRDRGDLERASALVSWLHRPSLDDVVVQLPWLSQHERARAASALRRLFADCGCLWGGAAFLLVTAAGLVVTARGGLAAAELGVTVGAAIAAAFAAKLAGLAWSRWRLRVWLQRIGSTARGGTR
jgi:hypothetical protein